MYNVFISQCPAKNVLQKSTREPIITSSSDLSARTQSYSYWALHFSPPSKGKSPKWIHSQNASVAAIDASDLEQFETFAVYLFFCWMVLIVGG